MAGRRREGQQGLPPQPPPKALELLSLPLARKPQLSNPLSGCCLQAEAGTKHVCLASPNLAGGLLAEGTGWWAVAGRESPAASPEGLRSACTAVTKAEGAATPRRCCCWAGKVRTVTWAQHPHH